MIRVEVKGGAEIKKDLEARRKAMADDLSKTIRITASDVRNESVKLIATGSRTGRIYREGTPRQHQASAPGEPPKSDTGRLVNSLAFRILNKLEAIAGVIQGDSVVVEYARSLEFGTRKMAPRPFMVPSVEASRPNFNRRIAAILQRAGS